MPGVHNAYTEFDRGSRLFLSVNLHVSKQYAAHTEAMPFASGVPVHAPQRKFGKMVPFDIF